MKIQSDSTVTFTQVYKDFKQGLEAVGDALKVGAEHVYEVLIRQQLVNSITWIIVIIALAIVGSVVLRFGLTNMWEERERYGEKVTSLKEEKLPLLFVGSCLCLAAIIVLCVQSGVIITGFINPEYGAMMEIKDMIK